MENFIFPQFTTNRKIKHDFHLFKKNKNDRYDAIFGRDLMQSLGIDILNSTQQFKWNGIEVDMVPTGHWSGHRRRKHLREFRVEQEINEVKTILESKYEVANLDLVVKELNHLTDEQKDDLLAIFNRYKDLFRARLALGRANQLISNSKRMSNPIMLKRIGSLKLI